MATTSPFCGTLGFLSVGSFKTAYLIPDGAVIISLVVAARDGSGVSPATHAPATVANEVDRNDLRALRVESDMTFPDSIENATAPF